MRLSFHWRPRPAGIRCNKCRQSCLEGFLNDLGIGCRQSVLFGQAPVRPQCSIIAGGKIVEFDDEPIAQFGRLPGSKDWLGDIA